MLCIQGGHHGLTEVHTWKNILYPFNDFEDIEFCVVYGWVRLHICRHLVASDKVSVCILCVFHWVLCREGLVPALFDCPETSSRHSRTGFMLEKWYFSQYGFKARSCVAQKMTEFGRHWVGSFYSDPAGINTSGTTHENQWLLHKQAELLRRVV